MSTRTHIPAPYPLFLLACLALLTVPFLLAGCSAQATPKAIAVYPQQTRSAPPAASKPLPPVVVYHAYLELEVPTVDQAAGQAARLATQYGGYLANLQSWPVDGQTITSLDLAVPTTSFDALRQKLRSLGTVLNESITGEPVRPQPGTSQIYPPAPSYSTITVQLRPGEVSWPEVPETGWNPGRTFQRAAAVFVTIFGFLADVLIWIVVVLGPFAVLGLVAYWIIRRARR